MGVMWSDYIRLSVYVIMLKSNREHIGVTGVLQEQAPLHVISSSAWETSYSIITIKSTVLIATNVFFKRNS